MPRPPHLFIEIMPFSSKGASARPGCFGGKALPPQWQGLAALPLINSARPGFNGGAHWSRRGVNMRRATTWSGPRSLIPVFFFVLAAETQVPKAKRPSKRSGRGSDFCGKGACALRGRGACAHSRSSSAGPEMHRGPCLSLALSSRGTVEARSRADARLFLRVIVSNDSDHHCAGFRNRSWVVKGSHQIGELLRRKISSRLLRGGPGPRLIEARRPRGLSA